MTESEGTRFDLVVGRGQRVSLIRVWPDIAAGLPPGERRVAEQALVAPLLRARDEDLAGVFATQAEGVSDFAVVEGVVLKETILATRSALEVLGPGDVLARPLSAMRQAVARAESRYLALGDAAIAPLGTPFKRVAARWVQVADFLQAQLAEQAHRASMHLAMLHQSRAEDRILALFTDLAERFGRVTPEGIVIDLPLTHDLIGRLTASRRPTVSLALLALDDAGALSRRDDGSWKLALRTSPSGPGEDEST